MSGQHRAVHAYRQASLESAPPLKIVRMLYQGALRFLGQAQRMDPKADAAEFNARLARADEVVAELRLALDKNAAGDLCENLERLYLYVEDRISLAMREGDVSPLDSAISVLEVLLDGWSAVETQIDPSTTHGNAA